MKLRVGGVVDVVCLDVLKTTSSVKLQVLYNFEHLPKCLLSIYYVSYFATKVLPLQFFCIIRYDRFVPLVIMLICDENL